ncbi:MAG: DUF5715 family protein [Janthinobacterium lividum]
MLISRGRPNSMSAAPFGIRFPQSCVRATTVLLALAAVTLPPTAYASVRHPAVVTHAATKAHVQARSTQHVAAEPLHSSRHAQAAPASHGSRVVVAAKSRRGAEHVVAAQQHGRPSSRGAITGYIPLSVISAQPSRQHRIVPHAPAVAQRHAAPVVATDDRAPNQVVEDRVHAWFRAQHPAADSGQSPAVNAIKAAAEQVVGSTTPMPPVPAAATEPDLSPVARKATTADFHRALQQQTATIRATVAANNTRTTADDDAAFAEASNIPSTAPTERVPAPFIHGDLLAATSGSGPVKQATLTAKADIAPVVRIDPRGDAEVLSAAANGATPIHLMPADSLSMPAPKAGMTLRSPAPAAGAIAAAARKPKLDPRVANTMTADAFDDTDTDNAPLPTGPAHLLKPDAGGYDVDLNAGPVRQVNQYDGAGKLILLPAMKGSHEILVHQNQMAIADGLDRIEDDSQMADMRRLKLLVALPDDDSAYPDGRLPANRRFARPWTVRFLNDLARAHYQRFQTPLIVTSAARTVAFQRRLVLTNGNAAPPTGNVASPHLYGQALDIAKHGMSVTELAWMRSYLTPVETAGKIDVEEEFQQACFHISVYRRYLGLPAPRNTPTPEVAPSRVLQQVKATPAKRRHIPTALLATGLR